MYKVVKLLNTQNELIQKIVLEHLENYFSIYNFNIQEIANTRAISALNEIKTILSNDTLSDFDAIEEIICIFEKYGIDTGNRHDF